MKNLSTLNQEKTMLSTEIVSIINSMREEGAAELLHKNFLAKIEKVLGESSAKFLAVYKDQQLIDRKCYHLPKREASLMVMSESYKVQAAVYDRMVELENKDVTFALPNFSDEIEAAKAWIQAKESEKKAFALIEAQSRVIHQKNEYIVASNEALIKVGEITVSKLVKQYDIIKIGRDRFFIWMREQGFIFKNSREPKQEYVDRGYFTWKPTKEAHGGKFRHELHITPRGCVWLVARYIRYLNAIDMEVSMLNKQGASL